MNGDISVHRLGPCTRNHVHQALETTKLPSDVGVVLAQLVRIGVESVADDLPFQQQRRLIPDETQHVGWQGLSVGCLARNKGVDCRSY